MNHTLVLHFPAVCYSNSLVLVLSISPTPILPIRNLFLSSLLFNECNSIEIPYKRIVLVCFFTSRFFFVFIFFRKWLLFEKEKRLTSQCGNYWSCSKLKKIIFKIKDKKNLKKQHQYTYLYKKLTHSHILVSLFIKMKQKKNTSHHLFLLGFNNSKLHINF